jgi:hypothetical protein
MKVEKELILFLTSFIGEEKLKKIKRDNLNCLEINLKDVDRKIRLIELKSIVLSANSFREIINRNIKGAEKIDKKNDLEDVNNYDNWLAAIILILIGYFGFKTLGRKKNDFSQ